MPATPERQPRALFGNAAFEAVAGSELVILEIAEHLMRAGWSCDVAAWSIIDPMALMAHRAGMGLLNNPAEVRPLTYDLVWIQNRIEAVMDFAPHAEDAPRTLFAFAHLDRLWDLAQPGVAAERILGGLFVTPSEEIAEMLVAEDLPAELIRPFRNAAPAAFEMPPPPPSGEPRTILVVSNHAPPELRQAIRLLREAGVMVTHWGSGGDLEGLRITPRAIAGADAVITIGKTVPYALRAGRPVYIYDHLGGPGWLRDAIFEAAARRNFSGRCTERRLEAEAIAAEVMEGYAGAAAEAAARDEGRIAPYRLEGFVEELLALAATAPAPAEHRARMEPFATALRAERRLAGAAGTYFAAAMRAHRHYLARQRTGASE